MPLRIQETFLFIRAFRPALGSIQLTSNRHRQHFSKWLSDYVVNLTTVKVKNACSSTSTPPYVNGLKRGPNNSLIEGIIANSFSRFSFIFHYSIFYFIRSFCLILQHSFFSFLPHSFHFSVIISSLSPCNLTPHDAQNYSMCNFPPTFPPLIADRPVSPATPPALPPSV